MFRLSGQFELADGEFDEAGAEPISLARIDLVGRKLGR